MKREGIVKWFKKEKGYGRIMLDNLYYKKPYTDKKIAPILINICSK